MGAARVDRVTGGRVFVALSAVAQVLAFIGFIILAKPTTLAYQDPVQDVQLYNLFLAITLMIFVGFGYLMTFLRFYGLGAVGLTMFVACLGMQLSIILEGLMEHSFKPFEVNMMTLLKGDFAVAAFLISFGGLIGKVNPAQLVVLVCIECVFYSANNQCLMVRWLNIKDCGGSIVIHMFGAYFGLAASWVLGKPASKEKERSSTISDIFSLVGAVFLWIYWPSFVGGLLPPGSVESDVALTNTVLALLGSTTITFIASFALSGHQSFRPGDIQNATLAGGVAIGAVANMNIQPWGALLIGLAAGLLSEVGCWRIQGFLEGKLGLHDTCGIHNLHGMPSVLGALCSVFLPLLVERGGAGELGKPLDQLLGMVFTLIMAVFSGLLAGGVMSLLKDDAEGFSDEAFWEVAPESPDTTV